MAANEIDINEQQHVSTKIKYFQSAILFEILEICTYMHFELKLLQFVHDII